jgi:hypothetical protein
MLAMARLQVFGARFEATKLKPYWLFGEAFAQKKRAQRRSKIAAHEFLNRL